jgi:hypothetical protein
MAARRRPSDLEATHEFGRDKRHRLESRWGRQSRRLSVSPEVLLLRVHKGARSSLHAAIQIKIMVGQGRGCDGAKLDR